MESVLHIEPISRQSPAPLHIGHTDHMFYGESLTLDDENVGDITSHMRLGAPLQSIDYGSPLTETSVPMVKTVEFMPDPSRKEGHVYLETTHYFKDRKFLIPFRTKLLSGLGKGFRINHLPSLNLARQNITGIPQMVCDPRSEIIADIALQDDIFRRRQNQPLRDWLTDDLARALDSKPFTPLSFDSDDINDMIPRYINQVRDTRAEFTQRDLKAIAETICPFLPQDEQMIPPSFLSQNPVINVIGDVRCHLVDNTFDFRSYGVIPIGKLHRIDYNPSKFQDICDLIDCIPLTDFNIDLMLSLDKEIIFYYEHLAINRFGAIDDVDIGLYQCENVFRSYFDGEILNEILERFCNFHSEMTDEIRDFIDHGIVKMKIMKTISDEAAILLYRHDSFPNDPPLCGVYFDIALQSLAPMSVIPMPVPN